jgi:hypothetical protein
MHEAKLGILGTHSYKKGGLTDAAAPWTGPTLLSYQDLGGDITNVLETYLILA